MTTTETADETTEDIPTKDTHIDGMEPVVIPELEEQAEKIAGWQKQHSEATRELTKENAVMLDLMKRNGVKSYVCRNRALKVDIEEGKIKAKVSKTKADIEDPDD